MPERVLSLGVDNATSLSAGVPPLHLEWRLKEKKMCCIHVRATHIKLGNEVEFDSSNTVRNTDTSDFVSLLLRLTSLQGGRWAASIH